MHLVRTSPGAGIGRDAPRRYAVSGSLIALQLTAMRLQRRLVDRAGLSGQIYLPQRVAEYREMWRQVAATQQGSFTELASDLWQIDVGDHRVRILNYMLEFDDPVTLGLAGRKSVVHLLLGAAGLPVPEHAVFNVDRLDVAREFVQQHPQGSVIKPVGGNGGKGVTTHVLAPDEVRRAAIRASLYDSQLLVERMIPGESYRILVLEGKVIDAVSRRGPRLQGDGASTIRQLLDSENARRESAKQPPLDVDRDLLFTLGYQDLALDSRPEPGRAVVVKSVNDPRGKSVDVRTVYTEAANDLVCDAIRQDAETAAQVIGSEFLGVDVITTDPSVPLRESGGVINEVNTTPALHHHYDASRQAYPDAAVLALQALLKRPATAVAAV
jgi:glutathione synthase/RimK-type ligase-like ATP-grasp enzyme